MFIENMLNETVALFSIDADINIFFPFSFVFNYLEEITLQKRLS